jgi:protein-tyrosine phosphatase
MAEAIFNVLVEERGLPYRAKSAGVSDLGAAPMSPRAREVLREAGIPTGDHRSREITEEMIRNSRLVLVMGPRHAMEISHRYGESEKVHLLQEYASGITDGHELPDPYGQSRLTYRASMRQIFECVEGVVDRLGRERP